MHRRENEIITVALAERGLNIAVTSASGRARRHLLHHPDGRGPSTPWLTFGAAMRLIKNLEPAESTEWLRRVRGLIVPLEPDCPCHFTPEHLARPLREAKARLGHRGVAFEGPDGQILTCRRCGSEVSLDPTEPPCECKGAE